MLGFYEMWKLLEETAPLVEGEENINTIGYHVSSVVFNQFDDNRLGSNTFQNGLHKMYSVDSFFGHQFYEDPNALYNYSQRKFLGYYMYKVNLRIGKAAVINIRKLKQICPDPPAASALKQQLLQAGYNGMRLFGGGKGRLTDNTVVAFSANSIRIRSVKNLRTGTELKAKDGPFQQQIDRLRSNPKYTQQAKAVSVTPETQPPNLSQLAFSPPTLS
jgi:hypothetical protein